MIYREAVVNTFNPPLSDEVRDRFLYEFANLCTAAVRFNSGQVVEEVVGKEQVQNYYAMAYLLGWKWRQDILIDVAKGRGWPEPEFVDFVHDMVIRLGIIPYNPNEPQNKQDYETALTEYCKTNDYVSADMSYVAWTLAHNKEHTPHVEQQLGLVERDRKKD